MASPERPSKEVSATAAATLPSLTAVEMVPEGEDGGSLESVPIVSHIQVVSPVCLFVEIVQFAINSRNH